MMLSVFYWVFCSLAHEKVPVPVPSSASVAGKKAKIMLCSDIPVDFLKLVSYDGLQGAKVS